MNRRNFLARLLAGVSGAAVAATFDVDRLLWVPGAKKIFLPSEEIFSCNTFLTPDWVTREAVKVLTDHMNLIGQFNRQWTEPLGHTFKMRTPLRFGGALTAD